jgi:hypothetical protein
MNLLVIIGDIVLPAALFYLTVRIAQVLCDGR